MENLWVATKALLAQLEPTADGDEIGVFENNSIYSYNASVWNMPDGDNYLVVHGRKPGRWVKTRTFALSTHNHLYTHYTKAQVDALLAQKAAVNHVHSDLYYSKDVIDALFDTLAKSTDVLPSSSFMPALPAVLYIDLSENEDPPLAAGTYGLWVDYVNEVPVLKFFDGAESKTITLDVD